MGARTEELDIKKDDAIAVLGAIYEYDKNAEIVLTGGEPSLYKDFFVVLDSASALFKKVSVCTNGCFDKAFVEKLKTYKDTKIQISIDGDEAHHDLMRGKGSYEEAVNSVRELLEIGMDVSVSTTVNKTNIASMFALADELQSCKVPLWKISMEQAFSLPELAKQISIKEWNDFVDKILGFAKIKVITKKLFDFELFERMEEKLGKKYIAEHCITNCGFCRSKLYVYPDCTVRGCTCINDITFGNLKHDSLEEVFANMAEAKSVQQVRKDTPCADCRWLYLCNGGCPGYSYFFKKDIGFGDIRCPKVKRFYGLQ
jgi:radical SAM protein with 4Fe4S-binding SPASM domain